MFLITNDRDVSGSHDALLMPDNPACFHLLLIELTENYLIMETIRFENIVLVLGIKGAVSDAGPGSQKG